MIAHNILYATTLESRKENFLYNNRFYVSYILILYGSRIQLKMYLPHYSYPYNIYDTNR